MHYFQQKNPVLRPSTSAYLAFREGLGLPFHLKAAVARYCIPFEILPTAQPRKAYECSMMFLAVNKLTS